MNDQYLVQVYQRLTGKSYDEARLSFSQLKILSPNTGNLYFQTYGIPNTIERPESPYERFVCYEKLLKFLQTEDGEKFLQMHKGTPYYFLSWLSFDISNYERANYYMSLALSEDQKNFPKNWFTTPGTNALLLNIEQSGPLSRVVRELKVKLQNEIVRFNLDTKSSLAIDNVVKNLLVDLAAKKNSKNTSSILTTLYTFIYESDDMRQMIKLGNSSGSLEALLSHLFKGGLIFESLLKHLYLDQKAKPNKRYTTLSDILKMKQVKRDFKIKGRMNISAESEEELLGTDNNNSLKFSFETTGKIRNFTGHDLSREYKLNNVDSYDQLFKHIVNSIFFIIKKHYS